MKERIDVLLVDKGYFPSRERAKAALMEGLVFVNGERIDKAGTKVDTESPLEVRGDSCPYVSRGGYKLAKAVEVFDIDLTGKVCCDIGASTGGFTDVMLQNGASKVFSVDVGYGQLDWKLRTDDRVVNIERCNARYLEPDKLGEKVDFASSDVSFISLSLIFPVIKKILKSDGEAVVLVKPQFEAGKEAVDKGKGVIRDSGIHEEVLKKVTDIARKEGLYTAGLDFSPVKGPKGNIEFLLHLVNIEKLGYNDIRVLKKIQETVETSHKELGEGGQE